MDPGLCRVVAEFCFFFRVNSGSGFCKGWRRILNSEFCFFFRLGYGSGFCSVGTEFCFFQGSDTDPVSVVLELNAAFLSVDSGFGFSGLEFNSAFFKGQIRIQVFL